MIPHVGGSDLGGLAAPGALDTDPSEAGRASLAGQPALIGQAKATLAGLWLLGSTCVLGWSLLRIYRFNGWLGMASELAPPELQKAASEIAQRLGLRVTPQIYLTAAHLPPLVWWAGGSRVRIFVPAALASTMDPAQLRWILAHELAHVRRRDHLVRWLEWWACVGFWWNPAAWWARHHLRINEELCCDALVLATLKPRPRTYGHALVSAVEYLATPALRPPAMASGINSGGILERRLRMIVANTPTPRASRGLRTLLAMLALCSLPLSVAYAQAPDHEAVARRLIAAVQAGELSASQAEAMMGELARARFAELLAASGSREAGLKARYQALEARIRAAVQAGEMSKEEAVRKLEAVKRELFGQEPPHDREQDARAEKLRAVEARLHAAVLAGEMTKEEAARELEAFRRELKEQAHHPDARMDRFRAVEAQLHAAVLAGEMSKEDAARKLEALKKEMAASERHPDAGQDARAEKLRAAEARIRAAIEAGELSPEDGRRKLEAIKKELAADRDSGHTGIEDHYRRLGVEKEELARIRGALKESGVGGEQSEQVLGVVLKLAMTMQSEGEHFELDARLQTYLQEDVGLTDYQVDTVLGLARRLAARPVREATIEDHYASMGVGKEAFGRIRGAVHEMGVADENLEKALGCVLRLAHGIKADGEQFELDARLLTFLKEELGLSGQQVEGLVKLARHVAAGLGD